VKGTSEARSTGLVAVRIAWITAILVCGLAILVESFSGTSGGSASGQLPGFAFSAGHDPSQRLPDLSSFDPAASMVGAAAREDRSGRAAKQKARGGRYSGSRIPPRSRSQQQDTSRGTPVITPRPKPPQAPGSDPAGAPQGPSPTQPKPPQASPVTPPQPAPAPPVISPEAPTAPSVDPPESPKPPQAPKPPKPLKPTKP
jgi:hypothetical protein